MDDNVLDSVRLLHARLERVENALTAFSLPNPFKTPAPTGPTLESRVANLETQLLALQAEVKSLHGGTGGIFEGSTGVADVKKRVDQLEAFRATTAAFMNNMQAWQNYSDPTIQASKNWIDKYTPVISAIMATGIVNYNTNNQQESHFQTEDQRLDALEAALKSMANSAASAPPADPPYTPPVYTTPPEAPTPEFNPGYEPQPIPPPPPAAPAPPADLPTDPSGYSNKKARKKLGSRATKAVRPLQQTWLHPGLRNAP